MGDEWSSVIGRFFDYVRALCFELGCLGERCSELAVSVDGLGDAEDRYVVRDSMITKAETVLTRDQRSRDLQCDCSWKQLCWG
jgi:hypothetical protein